MRTPMLLATLLLSACGMAPPPADPDKQAVLPGDPGHHELKQAIEARDGRAKAKAAGDAALEADKQHDQQLEDAEGGG